jgi:hypothetical protein
MIEFILTIVLMFSVGIIIYLIASVLPRIEEEEESVIRIKFLDRLAHSEIPGKIDEFLNKFIEKILRKLKIIILKLDNYINMVLDKIRIGSKTTPEKSVLKTKDNDENDEEVVEEKHR